MPGLTNLYQFKIYLYKTNDNRRLGDLKFMSRMRSAVEWSKQMDLDEEKAGGGGGGGGERQRGTWEEVELF